MSQELYYTAPPDEAFEEMKKCCIERWSTYDDTHKYASGKIALIKDLKNAQDNFMYMFAMFDQVNQMLVMIKLSPPTLDELLKRLD